ncbi:MAG TPA: TAXI family TRAP transporter solute-binding subunit [Atribacterota bacterium]|nr:TAXI family TRAP transporter solute-binding subunit [Atribacterota bacterium]
MFKKNFSLKFLFLFLITLVVFHNFNYAICMENSQNNKADSLSLMIAHASPGGSWHLFAEGVAEIIRKELPESNITVIPGGSDQNFVLLQKGEVDLAISATDSADKAINGWETFLEPIPMTDVNSLMRLFDSSMQIIVLESVGINSIEEIKEKKIPLKLSIGPRGSGMDIGIRRIFEEYGMTLDDIQSWGGKIVNFNQGESMRMVADGQLNACIILSAVPNADLVELAMKRKLKILPIREDVINNLVREHGYTAGIIPKDVYKGITADIPTLCVVNGFFVSGKLDEHITYLITKALIDNIDNLRQIHSLIKDITVDYMDSDMVFPMHPGAKRAYQEWREK